MKPLNTKIHGVCDYLIAAILIFSPWIFSFANYEVAQNIPVAVGIAIVVYSIFTDYEFGAVSVVNMPSHLRFDAITGLFLAASPWLYDFADYVFFPHVLIGLILVIAGLISQPKAEQALSVLRLN